MASKLPTRSSLNSHMYGESLPDDLRHLINDIVRAGKYIHHAIRTSDLGLAGSGNVFGEEQLKLDLLSNRIVEEELHESYLVHSYASEECETIETLRPDCALFRGF